MKKNTMLIGVLRKIDKLFKESFDITFIRNLKSEK